MTAWAATAIALAVAMAGCGNLARDVIVEKGSPIESDGGFSPDAAPDDELDAGEGRRSPRWRCGDHDGGCRKKAEENCNRYNCETWCQYLCGYIESSQCREKVHCGQNSSRDQIP